jgi:diguanylate cyclase (GGDEF)-like protein
VIIETIETITQFQPRVIGLHLYFAKRNDASRTRLKTLIETTENLIGMEKVVGSLRTTPSLFPREQLAMSDMVLDFDASVRRGLISIYDQDAKSHLNWGAQLALEYLATQSIKPIRQKNGDVQLGQAIISRLERGEGGYSPQLDSGGFQILMDYRGDLDAFTTISLRDVRSGNFDPDLFHNKIVAIGPTSPSLKTEYRTPIISTDSSTHIAALGSNNPKTPPDLSEDSDTGFEESNTKLSEQNDQHLMSSFLIHINLTSQLLDSAMLGQQGLVPVPAWLKWGWVAVGAMIGMQRDRCKARSRLGLIHPMMPILLTNGMWIAAILLGMLGIGYVACLAGWWLPTIAPIVAFGIATGLRLTYGSYHLYRLASYDALTQVGNRRLFDSSLAELEAFSIAKHKPLAVILCDIDWFKAYNDTYGHQQGDQCLKAVAQAIARVVRYSDIVTRYGGEEFAILLPETSAEQAIKLAERICLAVRSLEIEHRGAQTEAYVTLSCGVAVWSPDRERHQINVVKAADQALYRSKAQGRNTWQLETHWQDELITTKTRPPSLFPSIASSALPTNNADETEIN